MNKIIKYIILTLILTIFQPCIKADKYWEQKVSLFDELTVGPDDIIFLGNSITDGGNFDELFKRSDVKNRGIKSDDIQGVNRRLKQILAGHPKKIFLLIGINDISYGLTVEQLANRYKKLVISIMQQSPQTRLYLQSVMPINNDFAIYKKLINKENTIVEFNKKIKHIAETLKLDYIDLWPTLADSDGKLMKQFTNDGLHLMGAGYKAWISAIKPYLDE